MNMTLHFKRFNSDARAPYKKHDADAGYDLSAAHGGMIVPGQVAVPVRTGIGLELPHEVFALIRDRSSVAAKGIFVTAGVIDSNYRGEILVLLTNLGKDAYAFEPGDRIAQMLFLPCAGFQFLESEQLTDTTRGDQGFGSTGVATPPSGKNPTVSNQVVS